MEEEKKTIDIKTIDIICTLGTTTDDPKVLKQMIKYGMSCARINTAYATIPEYDKRIDLVRAVAASMNRHVDIMMDIKGPQIRLEADNVFPVEEGGIIIAGFKDEPLRFNQNFYDSVEEGDLVYFENGTIRTIIDSKKNNKLHLYIAELRAPDKEGLVYIHKCMGVNVPGKCLNLFPITKKDCRLIGYSVRKGVEYIAQSFVRSYEDVKLGNACINHINHYARINSARMSPAEKQEFASAIYNPAHNLAFHDASVLHNPAFHNSASHAPEQHAQATDATNALEHLSTPAVLAPYSSSLYGSMLLPASASYAGPKMIIKIEDKAGLDNLEDMIARSKQDNIGFSVMVARGDLFVELPEYELPLAEKKILQTCKNNGIYVINATGILESMQHSPYPTRAEVCDAIYAIEMGADALMFSGETSNGKNPAKAVKALSEIISAYSK